MSVAVLCRHDLEDLMPEYGGTIVYVVSGLDNAPKMAGQCVTGEHPDVPGGWRVSIPRVAVPIRKQEHDIAPCDYCLESKLELCWCTECACCVASLQQLIREHHALFNPPTKEDIFQLAATKVLPL